MIPRIRAEIREEILRLRAERLTYQQIAEVVRVAPATVSLICRTYFGDQVLRARAALMREVAEARREMATAPLFHPEGWS